MAIIDSTLAPEEQSDILAGLAPPLFCNFDHPLPYLTSGTPESMVSGHRARQKLILLSRAQAVNGAPGQVIDTILHQIAHPLAGPAAGHDPAWKAIATWLGATPKSCAPESDGARNTREAARAMFRTGDAVVFIASRDVRTGTIVRMNPKRGLAAKRRGRSQPSATRQSGRWSGSGEHLNVNSLNCQLNRSRTSTNISPQSIWRF